MRPTPAQEVIVIENKVYLSQEMILAVRKRFRQRLPGKRFSTYSLPMDLLEFAANNKDLIGEHLFRLYSEEAVSDSTAGRALAPGRSKGGCTTDFASLLGFYGFGEKWSEKALTFGFDPITFELKTSSKSSTDFPEAILENEYESKLRQKAENAIRNLENWRWSIEAFAIEELKILKKIQPLKSVIGTLPWKLIEQRRLINNEIVKGIKWISEDDEFISGFYIIYPVSMECCNLIREQKLIKSQSIESKHLCNDLSSASALYISVVYSIRNKVCRASLLQYLNEEITDLINRFPNIAILFSRPVTIDGERLSATYDFRPVGENSSIYYQETKHFSDKFKRHLFASKKQ